MTPAAGPSGGDELVGNGLSICESVLQETVGSEGHCLRLWAIGNVTRVAERHGLSNSLGARVDEPRREVLGSEVRLPFGRLAHSTCLTLGITRARLFRASCGCGS
jgi:hypothetical protein